MVERPESNIDAKELDRIERLRDRTDEIELIISGLTTLALFTVPGWLFEVISSSYSHHSLASSQAMEILLTVAPGLFYALGGCFAIHLMIRAYWAGLVGLRSVYPGGIIWDRIPGVGRLTREHYQKRLPDLGRAITSADHAASLLFAVISMIALSMLWVSVWMIIVLITGQFLGAELDLAAISLLLGLFVIPPSLLWILDALLGPRIPGLVERPSFRSVVGVLISINAWLWPQRLILPVQLTLQTNTRPFLFTIMITLSSMCIVIFGNLRYEAWTEFTVSEQFRYLDTAAIETGIDSAHYESLQGMQDRLRPVPTIDDFEQRSAFVRVFLPYYPQRDNAVLDAHCAEDEEAVDCLRGLWSVRLDARSIAPESLLPTERRDLNQRGLTGVLALTGLAPGLHRLEIVWNHQAESGDSDESQTFSVPFLFSPDQELAADAPSSAAE